MKKTLYTLLMLATLVSFSRAQEAGPYDILNAGKNKEKRCGSYFKVFNTLPQELGYSIRMRGRTIFLVFPSKQYFDMMYKSKTDGFAIDVVPREQFLCENPQPMANSFAHRGDLLPPVYKETFEQKATVENNTYLVIPYGKLPEKYDPKNVEFNLVVLQKKYFCDYRYFYNVDFNSWALLDTPLYQDSIKNEEAVAKYKEVSKTVNFTVPFEQDKTNLDASAVKPIYDTLNFTDYYVTKIKIDAYASVEGTLERNIKLQQGRAQVIVDALKTYQSESIESEVNAKEDWESFKRDIAGTKFADMASLENIEVKRKLAKDPALMGEIESILGPHRRADIEITLEKRTVLQKSDGETLKTLFGQAITEENIDEALYIQQVIMDKIKTKSLPADFLETVSIPESLGTAPLLNNKTIFKAEMDESATLDMIREFERLRAVIGSGETIHLLYNITALKIKLWTSDDRNVNKTDLQRAITNLEKIGFAPQLVKKLKINYNIVLTDYLMRQNNFQGKSNTLRAILNETKKMKLNDADLVSLAKYMSYYSELTYAFNALKTRVLEPDASTDLIFFYLNLTITEQRKTRREEYQELLQRAIDRDPERFCKMFKPKAQGGITFQLLDDRNLKPIFCATCSEN